MILAFQASDRGSNQNLSIFIFCCFLFAFRCFYFDLFSALSLTASTIRQLLHLRIKSQKAVESLYCVQKFRIFLCPHSCLHNRAIFDPMNEDFMQRKNMFTLYIYKYIFISLSYKFSDVLVSEMILGRNICWSFYIFNIIYCFQASVSIRSR